MLPKLFLDLLFDFVLFVELLTFVQNFLRRIIACHFLVNLSLDASSGRAFFDTRHWARQSHSWTIRRFRIISRLIGLLLPISLRNLVVFLTLQHFYV